MKIYKQIMNILAKIEGLVLLVTTAIILILVFGNVITRKLPFIKTSWSFTEELVIALFVLISLLASALCCRENSNISLSLLSEHLSGRKSKILKIATSAISLIYCGILTYEGWGHMMAQYEAGVHTFVLHWPEWVFCAFVPVSGICMMLHLIEHCIDFCNEQEREEA